MRVLVVTAVAAEADSVAAGLARAGYAPPGPEPAPVRVPVGHAAPDPGPDSVRVPTEDGSPDPVPGSVRVPAGHPSPDPAPGSVRVPAGPASPDPVPGSVPGSVRPVGPPPPTRFRGGGGHEVDVLPAGVGPAAAAAGTALALARTPYDLVVSAGIGGGFPARAPLGSLVVASEIVAADLGAGSPDGFIPVTSLGFGRDTLHPPLSLSRAVARALGALEGPVLTVTTATGTADRAAGLLARHPAAAAEAMEGFGVAEAAAQLGVPAIEIRAISNSVGPRDRSAWRIGDALAALTDAFGKFPPVLESWTSHD
ncbi:futalosine hydrolase [Streptomyces sp. NPDC050485]|uniref:futalosine hydrolase n=1 Tax=Streptomyces sp. NPDC050485 TaxID=3365617 RepID=UPI003795A9F7